MVIAKPIAQDKLYTTHAYILSTSECEKEMLIRNWNVTLNVRGMQSIKACEKSFLFPISTSRYLLLIILVINIKSKGRIKNIGMRTTESVTIVL